MAAKNSGKQAKKDIADIVSAQTEETEGWFANGLHRFIIVFSVMWFAIVAIYITSFFGWDNLFSMLPNEFSGFMATITLPLAIVWVIMAYIDRGNSYKNETRMLRDSLSQIIFPDSDGSAATKMIAEAIKSQVSELKEVTRDVCAQSDVIKRDLTDRVEDLKQLAEALDKYSSQTMSELNVEIQKLVDNFGYVTEKATGATADFRVNTMQMKEDSEKLVNILTPMVNQMVTAAERVKEVVDVNNENIARAQEQLNTYSETSQLAIGRIIESWSERGENLEKTFLRTSENCEELFRRLDSGISHIESSIMEQKQVVETQSALIEKNSGYLDNKLGEYGKLISLEVEAMINRSGTLEANIQKQLKTIREASAQTTEAFSSLGNNITEKRKILETESLQVINNINLTVNSLGEEMKHLHEFYEKTKDKNSDFSNVFNMVSQGLKEIETSLATNIGALQDKTAEILADFQKVNATVTDNITQVNGAVSDNVAKLVESSNVMSEQSKANADLLIQQDTYLKKAMAKLDNISSKLHNQQETYMSNTIVKLDSISSKLQDQQETYINNTIAGIEDVSNKLRHQQEASIKGILENIRTMSAQLQTQQSDYVSATMANLDSISSKISVLNKGLQATGKELGTTLGVYERKISDFDDKLIKQLGFLKERYDQTQQQMNEYNQKQKEAGIDRFMKTSADIIQELESISIDVNAIFNKNGNKDDDLWKKYYDGDKGVFVRHLAKNMTKKEILAIQEDYAKKADFRIIVDKYLDDFNSLINVARENERASTLLALISGSDIGKVYYILAKALGKVN